MVSRKVSASSFINLNDWNIASKELLAKTFVKTNPANKYLLTQSQKANTRCKRCSKMTINTGNNTGKVSFSVFQELFACIKKTFWLGVWVLRYHSMGFRHFPDIS